MSIRCSYDSFTVAVVISNQCTLAIFPVFYQLVFQDHPLIRQPSHHCQSGPPRYVRYWLVCSDQSFWHSFTLDLKSYLGQVLYLPLPISHKIARKLLNTVSVRLIVCWSYFAAVISDLKVECYCLYCTFLLLSVCNTLTSFHVSCGFSAAYIFISVYTIHCNKQQQQVSISDNSRTLHAY